MRVFQPKCYLTTSVDSHACKHGSRVPCILHFSAIHFKLHFRIGFRCARVQHIKETHFWLTMKCTSYFAWPFTFYRFQYEIYFNSCCCWWWWCLSVCFIAICCCCCCGCCCWYGINAHAEHISSSTKIVLVFQFPIQSEATLPWLASSLRYVYIYLYVAALSTGVEVAGLGWLAGWNQWLFPMQIETIARDWGEQHYTEHFKSHYS